MSGQWNAELVGQAMLDGFKRKLREELEKRCASVMDEAIAAAIEALNVNAAAMRSYDTRGMVVKILLEKPEGAK